MNALSLPTEFDHSKLFAAEGLDGAQVLRLHRSAKAERYQRMLDITKRRLQSDPSFRARMNRAVMECMASPMNAALLEAITKGVSPGSVHQNAFLDNFSVQFANDDFVAEKLMPIVPVSKRSNSYAVYTKRDRFGFPDDTTGPDGRSPEISESRSAANYSVSDYGLMNSVTQETLDNQDDIFDEMLDLTDAINEGIAFNREKRVSAIVRNVANYNGNTETLSGASQWGGGGNPIVDIQDGLASTWRGPGAVRRVFVSGLEVYNVLARDPLIRDLYKYTGQGLAMPAAIAGYFGVDEYLIAQAREDTANSGQTAAYSRIWGKDFACLNVQRRPSKRTATWGVTFRMKNDPIVLQWFDPSRGRGAYFAKVCCSEDYRVVAGETGFLIKDAVA